MSVFLSDYLEELFPEKEPKLYPKDDPFKKYKQRLLVETVGSAVSTKLLWLLMQKVLVENKVKRFLYSRISLCRPIIEADLIT